MLRYMTDEEVKQNFGTFQWVRADNRSEIVIAGNWVQENLGRVFIPQLEGKDVFGTPSSGNIYCHKKLQPNLKAAFAEVEARGLLDLVIAWGGMFCSRMIRGSRDRISRHSWGIAFDINMKENPLGQVGAPIGTKGSVLALVSIFEKHGFIWGGNFPRPDWMHFEAGFLEKEPEPEIIEGSENKMSLVPLPGKSRTKSKTIWFNAITAILAVVDSQFGVFGLVDKVSPQYLILAVNLINWVLREKTSEGLKPIR